MTDDDLIDLSDASLSIEHSNTDYSLRLRWWVVDNPGTRTVAECRIPASQITDLLRDLTQHGLIVLDRAAQAYEYGNCTTCDNRRLVESTEHGRTRQVSCPDCRKDGIPTAFTHVPRPFKSASNESR